MNYQEIGELNRGPESPHRTCLVGLIQPLQRHLFGTFGGRSLHLGLSNELSSMVLIYFFQIIPQTHETRGALTAEPATVHNWHFMLIGLVSLSPLRTLH